MSGAESQEIEWRKRGARFAANTTNIDIDIARHDFCATPTRSAHVIALRFLLLILAYTLSVTPICTQHIAMPDVVKLAQ